MLAFQLSGENNQTTFLAHARVNPDGSEGKIVPALRRLTKNQFYVKHRGSNGKLPIASHLSAQVQTKVNAEQKTWICKRIHNKNAKQHKFEVTVKETGKKVTMSVFEYFVKRYNVTLVRWELPLIETNKKDVFYPMEVAIMKSGQRYPYKLNELQVRSICESQELHPTLNIDFKHDQIRRFPATHSSSSDPAWTGHSQLGR